VENSSDIHLQKNAFQELKEIPSLCLNVIQLSSEGRFHFHFWNVTGGQDELSHCV